MNKFSFLFFYLKYKLCKIIKSVFPYNKIVLSSWIFYKRAWNSVLVAEILQA